MRATVAIVLVLCHASAAAVITVDGDGDLRLALREAKPGVVIRIRPGTYAGGVSASNLAGTETEPIVIEAADPDRPPVFAGGVEAIHLTDAQHVTLRNLVIRGQSGNGINIDDGGSYDTPARHITLENIAFREIGPKGNRDALKLSGVDDFSVRNCSFQGWGGQAIDMVGCHRGRIDACDFRALAGFDSTTGAQAKGASSHIVITRCTFAGPIQRGVNAGGSTGLEHFRPAVPDQEAYEANAITVEGCEFADGVIAPIAFVGVDGAAFRGNTIRRPGRFVFRILQETTAKQFVPCRNGQIERNVIVFRRADVREPVNIGPGTHAGSFKFVGNTWYCEDDPPRSKPSLPSPETAGVYGIAPPVK